MTTCMVARKRDGCSVRRNSFAALLVSLLCHFFQFSVVTGDHSDLRAGKYRIDRYQYDLQKNTADYVTVQTFQTSSILFMRFSKMPHRPSWPRKHLLCWLLPMEHAC